MRYPLWAFLAIFVLPPFTVHAVLSGRAEVRPPEIAHAVVADAPVNYHKL